jgi:hypothetical protein
MFACPTVILVGLLFASQVSAEPWLEDSGRANEAKSEKTPDELKWAVTLYGGRVTKDALKNVVSFSAKYSDSYLGVVALSWQFAQLGKHIRLEVEGQVGKYFGEQDHWELNALAIARWVTFPWNAYLDTSFAAGEGISYATEVPELEAGPGASQALNYLLFEVSFALPAHPEWALVGRIHHRSGFWGALAPNGSNAFGLGVKYRF